MKVRKRAVAYYKDGQGREPAREWLNNLKDDADRKRIFLRLRRAEEGNLGDHKSLRDGVSELRIHAGPGYRVYYAITEADTLILLLIAGDKSSQFMDIQKAKNFWKEYKKCQ